MFASPCPASPPASATACRALIGDSRIALHRAGALPAPNRMHNCASVPEVPAARGPDGLIREKNLERRDKHTAIIIDI